MRTQTDEDELREGAAQFVLICTGIRHEERRNKRAGGAGQGKPVLAGLMLATLLTALSQEPSCACRAHQVGELGRLSLMLWAYVAYFMFSTMTVPIYGKIGDLTGRKCPQA